MGHRILFMMEGLLSVILNVSEESWSVKKGKQIVTIL